MKNYFLSKLFNINYRIATHEGNANRRLASQATEILFQLAPNNKLVPDPYKIEFSKLITLLNDTLAESEGRVSVRVKGIQNRTAAKYIKLLIDIREYLED